MKVLFIQPPWGDAYGGFKSAARLGNAYPPLGLCYLSACLKQRGVQTRIIDAEMEDLTLDDCLRESVAFAPDFVCMTATSSIFHLACDLAQRIKGALDAPIIVGGAHVTAVKRAALTGNLCFDYGVYGEGEDTLLELVDVLDSRKNRVSEVTGLIYKNSAGDFVMTPPRPLITDLNRIPVPDRESLALDRYVWSVPGKGIVRFTTLMTSRGCPFKCIFCSAHTVFGRTVRNRSMGLVLNEVEHLVHDHRIRHLALIDDTLTLDHGRVKEFCRGIRDRKLDITWEGWTRANTVDEDILKTMKDAGFVRISFGIESGNPQVLKHIHKEVDLDHYARGYELARKLGIETRGSVMLGHPYETRQTALETLRFIKKLKNCQQMYINITTPYPGTELYDMAMKGEGGIRLLTNDFSKYKRYGEAVIEVNDLTAKDLVNLQREGFRMFYFTPGRILHNIGRAGWKAAILNGWAFFKSVIWPMKNK